MGLNKLLTELDSYLNKKGFTEEEYSIFHFGSEQKNVYSDVDVVIAIGEEHIEEGIKKDLNHIYKNYKEKGNYKVWIESLDDFFEKDNWENPKKIALHKMELNEDWIDLAPITLLYKMGKDGKHFSGKDIPRHLTVGISKGHVDPGEGYELFLLASRYLAKGKLKNYPNDSPNEIAKAILYAGYSVILNAEEGLKENFEEIKENAIRIFGHDVKNKDMHQKMLETALSIKKGNFEAIENISEEELISYFESIKNINMVAAFERGYLVDPERKEAISKYFDLTSNKIGEYLEKVNDIEDIPFTNFYIEEMVEYVSISESENIKNFLEKRIKKMKEKEIELDIPAKILNSKIELALNNPDKTIEILEDVFNEKEKFLKSLLEEAVVEKNRDLKKDINEINLEELISEERREEIVREHQFSTNFSLKYADVKKLYIESLVKEGSEGSFKKADKEIKKSIKNNPMDSEIWELYGEIKKYFEELDKSKVCKYISTCSEDPTILTNLKITHNNEIAKLFFDSFRNKFKNIIESEFKRTAEDYINTLNAKEKDILTLGKAEKKYKRSVEYKRINYKEDAAIIEGYFSVLDSLKLLINQQIRMKKILSAGKGDLKGIPSLYNSLIRKYYKIKKRVNRKHGEIECDLITELQKDIRRLRFNNMGKTAEDYAKIGCLEYVKKEFPEEKELIEKCSKERAKLKEELETKFGIYKKEIESLTKEWEGI